MKKHIGVLLCLALMILCTAVLADTSGTCGPKITWTLDDDGTLRIQGEGDMEDGTAWRETISADAVRSLVIGEGVTGIGEKSFFGCTQLAGTTLPESLARIGDEAFQGCDALKTMNLPAGIQEIASGLSFSEATETFVVPAIWTDTGKSLGYLDIPFRVPGDINRYLFAWTEDGVYIGLTLYEPPDVSAEHIHFPDGIETIREGFFKPMKNLKSARIPSSVTKLSMGSFAGVYRYFHIQCEKGSYAEQFALEHGFQYDNGEERVIGWDITDPAEKVKWIVSHYVRPGMSDKQKALVLHNWLTTNCHYDKTLGNHDENILLTKGYGVCEAYSYAYYELLKKAGIAVGLFDGDSRPAGSTQHEWNVVRIGGKWYHVDVTWDDPTQGPQEYPSVSGQERTAYFLRTDKKMNKDHQWARYLSPDRGRIWQYYDPAQKKKVTLIQWDDDFYYLLNWKKKTALLIDTDKDRAKDLTIPATYEFIHESGSTTLFKITGIDDKVFKGHTKLRSIVIGKNIETIGKEAFTDCSGLKSLTFETAKLTKSSVGQNAFKGLPDKATVKVPKKQLKLYKKILRKAGLPKKAEFTH